MATVEVALEVIREERDAGEVGRLRERLGAVGPEIARLVDLAQHVGGNLPEIAGRIRALKAERTALETRVRELELEVLDVEALRPRIEARLSDLRRHLAEDGRDALRALFRGERLRVGPDPDRGYRVDGRAWLRLPAREGARRSAGRAHMFPVVPRPGRNASSSRAEAPACAAQHSVRRQESVALSSPS